MRDEAGQWERNFRQRIVALRTGAGLTQTDLAKTLREEYRLPFHQATVQRIESGERPIRLNEAHLIARALGSDLEAMTATPGTPETVRFALDLARDELSSRAADIVDVVSETLTGMDVGELKAAWTAYTEAQKQSGEPVDDDLQADVEEVLNLLGEMDTAWIRVSGIYELTGKASWMRVEGKRR